MTGASDKRRMEKQVEDAHRLPLQENLHYR